MFTFKDHAIWFYIEKIQAKRQGIAMIQIKQYNLFKETILCNFIHTKKPELKIKPSFLPASSFLFPKDFRHRYPSQGSSLAKKYNEIAQWDLLR